MATHAGTVELGAGFAGAHAWVAERGEVALITRLGTRYEVLAISGRRGAHAAEPMLRFMRNGVESARAYACCWGHTYNCYGASIGSCCRALDEQIRASPGWWLEEAALTLLCEHDHAPYARLTHAEACAALAAAMPDRTVATVDDQPMRLVHLGYPASFDGDPRRPGRAMPRGEGDPIRYDVAVLYPAAVRRARAESVSRGEAELAAPQAIVQVVLDDRGLGKRRMRVIRHALRTLRLATDVEERLLLVLMRYRRNTLKAWERDWPRIEKALERSKVRAAVSVYWVALGAVAEQGYWGRWLHPIPPPSELGRLPRRLLGAAKTPAEKVPEA